MLFERRPDGIVPTAAGELVVDRAQACLAHLATGTRQVGGTAFETGSPAQHDATARLRGAGAGRQHLRCSRRPWLSQPAVHRAVRELEEALGRKLVERRGRGVHVNFAGRRFARSCRLALAELPAAFSELGRDPHNPTIVSARPPGTWLPRARGHGADGGGTVSRGFRVHEGSWANWWRRSGDGVIDIIVGEIPDDAAPDLATHPLYEEALVVAGGSIRSRRGAVARRRCWLPTPGSSRRRTRRCVPNGSASSPIAAPRRRWSAARS